GCAPWRSSRPGDGAPGREDVPVDDASVTTSCGYRLETRNAGCAGYPRCGIGSPPALKNIEGAPVKKAVRLTALAGAAALALAACGEAPTESTGDGSAAASDFKPCIVSDAGGFDDTSFNQLSVEGAQDAAAELGAELVDVQSAAETDYKGNVESLVAEACDAIVTVGFALSATTIESATASPEIDYIIIDDAADGDFDGKADADNIKPLLYDTAQDRKSTRLNSSHVKISYAVFCLKNKKQ